MREIPRWLLSDETGEEFRHCVRCRLPLLEVAAPWVVNKDYLRGECVREYAICQPCKERVTEGFSEESKAAMRRLMAESIDWEARLAEFMMHDGMEARFAACVACRTPREEMDEYSVSGLFDAEGYLQEGSLPLLVCGGCVGKAMENMSGQTREAWELFLGGG